MVPVLWNLLQRVSLTEKKRYPLLKAGVFPGIYRRVQIFHFGTFRFFSSSIYGFSVLKEYGRCRETYAGHEKVFIRKRTGSRFPVLNFQKIISVSDAVVCILLFLSSGNLWSEDSIRYTADVTRLPVSTDIAALGDMGVVLPRHAAATIWNPAAAALLRRYEFSMEGADLYRHLSQQGCFAGAVPLKHNLGAAISYQPFYSGRIDLYDSIPDVAGLSVLTQQKPEGFMRNYHHLGNIALAGYYPFQLPRIAGTDLPVPVDIAAGVNLKVYAQTMVLGKMYIGIGYNADIGILARIGLDQDLSTGNVRREFYVGASIRDVLPTSVVWMFTDYQQLMYSPMEYREPFHVAQYYGIAYTDRSGFLSANWTVALGLSKEYQVKYHGGIEAEFWDMASFRAGFSGKSPTLGAGLRYRRFFVDYAFRFEEIAFSLVRLTLGVWLPVAEK